MRARVIDRVHAAALAHHQMVEALSEEDLGRRLGDRSNTIGAQMWCVVGARESHVNAIEHDGWVGLGCSLSGEDVTSKERVLEALARSGAALTETGVGSARLSDLRRG